MKRTLPRLLLVAALLVGLPACSRDDSAGDELRAALAKTKQEAGQFVYIDERPGETVRVAGVLEDDFRYKALVSVGK